MRTSKIWAQFSAQTTQNLAQFRVRSMKTWAQICKHKYFYIGCLKTQQQLHFVNGGKTKNYFIFYFLYVIRAGRCLIGQYGPVRAGRSALRNMPSWNTEYIMHTWTFFHSKLAGVPVHQHLPNCTINYNFIVLHDIPVNISYK